MSAERSRLEGVVEAMHTCMQSLPLSNDLRAFQIAGVDASPALTTSLLTAASTYFSVLFSLAPKQHSG